MRQFLVFLLSVSASIGPLMAESTPIDVVYTWVDGADETWRSELNDFIATHELEGNSSAQAISRNRFQDHNELRYSLRSLEAFAPWVHHIYIVTCGQRPSWYQEHPKVTFVNHKEIFKDHTNLPTYNSMAIESNLHRIPGLSEHYIYFNDDVFLGRPTTQDVFYNREDRFSIFIGEKRLDDLSTTIDDAGYWAASKNTLSFMNVCYRKRHRYQHDHTPFPCKRSVIQRIEQRHPQIFALVSSHHFRSLHDYTITNGLIPYVALEKGWAVASKQRSTQVSIGSSYSDNEKSFEKILRDRPLFFCLQDTESYNNPAVECQWSSFFEKMYPNPAPWEKGKTEIEIPPPVQDADLVLATAPDSIDHSRIQIPNIEPF